MKDGTTRLAYKAEHAVDLDSGTIVSTEPLPSDRRDAQTLIGTVARAGGKLETIGLDTATMVTAADKVYYLKANAARLLLAVVTALLSQSRGVRRGPDGLRYLGKFNEAHNRSWLGESIQRLRTMHTERSFAHLLETGQMRRLYL